MSKKWLFVLILILVSNIAVAATIHGTVYNTYLEKQSNSVVYVNTVPKQTYVAKDASYSFELSSGDYEITAKFIENGAVRSEVMESISVKEQGDYVVDLILFPVFTEEQEILDEADELNIEEDYFGNGTRTIEIVVFVAALIGLGFVVYLLFKYKKVLSEVTNEVKKTAEKFEKAEVPDESKNVIDFIKKQGGRVSQKDIRKHFPSSEAKISLIISDLEDKKVVKKIKKGRGNVIVLK